MIIYRYEHKDGGGPFLTKEGQQRGNIKSNILDNGYKYGCKTLEGLNEYFKD